MYNINGDIMTSNVDGVLFINKPKGITSFDVVREIKKIFKMKKVGHTGTLDPLATGVMLVCLGKATKIVELLTAEDKEYVASAKLGIKTDTLDITGKVIDKKEIIEFNNLEEVLNSFKKTYMQEVPIYSAVKIKGKKLYEYARNKEDIDLPKREVTIKEIELLEQEKDTFKFRVLVTKGCYIRSLINDIGQSLNTYATMTDLERTKQVVDIKDTNTLEDIKNNNYTLHSIEDVLNYPVQIVDEELEYKISNGVKLDNIYNVKDKIIFKNKNNKLLGIYQLDKNKLKVWKNFI